MLFFYVERTVMKYRNLIRLLKTNGCKIENSMVTIPSEKVISSANAFINEVLSPYVWEEWEPIYRHTANIAGTKAECMYADLHVGSLDTRRYDDEWRLFYMDKLFSWKILRLQGYASGPAFKGRPEIPEGLIELEDLLSLMDMEMKMKEDEG